MYFVSIVGNFPLFLLLLLLLLQLLRPLFVPWKNETRGGSFLGERERFAAERGEKLFSRGENLVVKGEPDF